MSEMYNDLQVRGIRVLGDATGVYKRATAVGATPGDGVLINTGTAGTVTMNLANGGSITVTVPVGTTLLPFGVTSFAVGTATGATAQSVFWV